MRKNRSVDKWGESKYEWKPECCGAKNAVPDQGGYGGLGNEPGYFAKSKNEEVKFMRRTKGKNGLR